MLWYVAAAYARNFLSSVKASKAAEKAQIEANKRTATGYMQQMNYTFQNAEIQRQSLFASAIDELTKVRRQATRQQASILAAVGEAQGYGRTANAISRVAKGDEARTAGSIAQNYHIKMNEIDLNKEAALISTKNAIDSIPAVSRRTTASYFMEGLGTYYNFLKEKEGLEALQSGRDTGGGEGSYSSFFSPSSIFKTDPVADYYNGIGTDNRYYYGKGHSYTGAKVLGTIGGGDYRWQNRLLVANMGVNT